MKRFEPVANIKVIEVSGVPIDKATIDPWIGFQTGEDRRKHNCILTGQAKVGISR